MELPLPHGRVETRTGARQRLLHGPEAVKDDLPFRAVLRRSHQGCPAARCIQRHHGRRLKSRPVHARPQGLLQTGIHRFNGSRSFRCQSCGRKLIPATLELGGKSANIFFADCNLEQAYDGAQLGILFNQGQVCCAGSRIFVQEDIYDEFVAELANRFNKVKIGLPWKEDTQLGATIYKSQLDKVLSYVELAKEEGATIACGGEQATDGELKNGIFMKPTLITNATNDMRVAREEILDLSPSSSSSRRKKK